jgi:hypothetical protein
MAGNCALSGQPGCQLAKRSDANGRVAGAAPVRLLAGDEEDPLERLAGLLAGRIVERLAPLLASSTSGRSEVLVDAHEIARRTGRSRWWVYEHAGELGAVRLGAGPRARLGFWPARVEAYIQGAADLRAPMPSPPRTHTRRRRTTHTPIELLAFTRDDERATGLPSAFGRD